MTNLAKVTTTGSPLPPPQTPEQRRRIAALTSGATIEAGRMVLLPGKEIAPDERRGMEVRLSTLRSSLDQRDRKATEAIVAAFLASYGSTRGNDSEMRLVVGTFASVLSDIPPWAVAEAARAWTRGGYGATVSAFAPSAAQFYECAERIIRNYAREAGDIEALLSAETTPTPPDEKKRVSAGLDGLLDEMRAAAGEKPKETPLSAKLRFEEMCREAGVDPTTIKDQPVSMQRLRATG